MSNVKKKPEKKNNTEFDISQGKAATAVMILLSLLTVVSFVLGGIQIADLIKQEENAEHGNNQYDDDNRYYYNNNPLVNGKSYTRIAVPTNSIPAITETLKNQTASSTAVSPVNSIVSAPLVNTNNNVVPLNAVYAYKLDDSYQNNLNHISDSALNDDQYKISSSDDINRYQLNNNGAYIHY